MSLAKRCAQCRVLSILFDEATRTEWSTDLPLRCYLKNSLHSTGGSGGTIVVAHRGRCPRPKITYQTQYTESSIPLTSWEFIQKYSGTEKKSVYLCVGVREKVLCAPFVFLTVAFPCLAQCPRPIFVIGFSQHYRRPEDQSHRERPGKLPGR